MGQVLVMADYPHLKRPKCHDPLAASRYWFDLSICWFVMIAEWLEPQGEP